MFALLTASAWAGAAAQDRLPLLRDQFQAERDVVHQAKNFSKLGDALLAEVRRQAEAGDVSAARAAFEEYRDDVRRLLTGLKATGRNAERHPSGFKELQIYLRKTLRNLDQLVLLVPFESREPFDGLRRDIGGMDEELFHLLFPRQPAPEHEGKPQSEFWPPGLARERHVSPGRGSR